MRLAAVSAASRAGTTDPGGIAAGVVLSLITAHPTLLPRFRPTPLAHLVRHSGLDAGRPFVTTDPACQRSHRPLHSAPANGARRQPARDVLDRRGKRENTDRAHRAHDQDRPEQPACRKYDQYAGDARQKYESTNQQPRSSFVASDIGRSAIGHPLERHRCAAPLAALEVVPTLMDVLPPMPWRPPPEAADMLRAHDAIMLLCDD